MYIVFPDQTVWPGKRRLRLLPIRPGYHDGP
jgi:hypothetical protein